MPVVIGLIGEKRAGKGTFVKFLPELAEPKKVGVVRSVDILYETLKIWDIEPTRSNLQSLAIIMDEKYGKGTLTNAVKKKIFESMDDVVVFDGVRWPTDVELVRSFEKNFLVYVTASPKLRWERGKLAGEKAGEDKASFEQFMEEEKAYTEEFIPKIGAGADFKIANEGTLEDYRSAVRKFCEEKLTK
jgi:dephospho-CoA kinase